MKDDCTTCQHIRSRPNEQGKIESFCVEGPPHPLIVPAEDGTENFCIRSYFPPVTAGIICSRHKRALLGPDGRVMN